MGIDYKLKLNREKTEKDRKTGAIKTVRHQGTFRNTFHIVISDALRADIINTYGAGKTWIASSDSDTYSDESASDSE